MNSTFGQKQRGYLFAILSSIMFGSVPIIAKPLVSQINPIVLSSVVYLCAFFVFIPIAYKSKTSFKKNDYIILAIIGVGSAFLSPILYFVGLEQSKASDTSLLSNAEIVFTVILAILFFKERLRPVGYFAMVLVMLGVFVISTNLDFSHLEFNYGHLLILGATGLWALDNNLSRIISERINSARLVQIKYGIGGVLMVATMFSLQIPFKMSSELFFQTILLSLAGFGGALYFFLLSLKRLGTLRTIVIFSLSSVFGLIFSAILLGEKISIIQIFAIGMMLFGVYLISRDSLKKLEL